MSTMSGGEGPDPSEDDDMTAIATEAPWVPDVDFGARLWLARHTAGLDLREAADLCQLNYRTWQSWEAGRRPQDMADVVTKIAAGLGVDRHWLMWGEDGPGAVRMSREQEPAGQRPFSGSDIDQLCDAAEDLARSFTAA